MTVTQRGQLTEKDVAALREVVAYMDRHEAVMDEYRAVVAGIVGRSSYREVARVTGISTNTLQRWKREAGR